MEMPRLSIRLRATAMGDARVPKAEVFEGKRLGHGFRQCGCATNALPRCRLLVRN